MQDNDILISFVVPVYNVEKYLNECLDSIFDPSVDASLYEVIAVNDGSTDGSPAILETYTRHENFMIINQENHGLSVTRNVGIKHAIGKYVFFIDSDDYLASDSVDKLLQFAATSDCDIIKFNLLHLLMNADEVIDYPEKVGNGEPLMTGKDSFSRDFLAGSCARLLRREFLLNHELFFYPGIKYEDFEWSPRCLFYARKLAYPRIPLYIYRERPGSIITTEMTEKSWLDYILISERLAVFRDTIEPSAENAFFRRELGHIIAVTLKRAIRWAFRRATNEERQELVGRINNCRNLLALTADLKDRLRYCLTRPLPAKIAFWIYNL